MAEELDDPEHQRRYYESLIAVSPTAIVTTDADMRVTSWNPAAEHLFGYTSEEAIGRDVDDLVSNDEQIRREGLELNHLALEGPIQRFTRRTRKDGTLVDVALRAAQIVVGDEFAGLYAFYDDIGELVRQRRYFESLLETSPVAVIMIDRASHVTSWNPAAEKLFGYTADEAIGTHIDDLVANRPEIRPEADRFTAEAWQSPGFHRITRRTRKDGSLVDVEISSVRVTLEGDTIGYYVIYHDITELEQTRRQLEARIDDQLAELVRRGELARFLPRQVAEGLMAGQLAPDHVLERRKITALFADMVGFTDLSESLEPEELAEVLNEYLREMTAIVMAHGGTLDNFIGDGIMAVFGAPERVDETEQAWAAVRAAVEMRSRCRELATRLRSRGIPADLDIRVGLNTGHCTVGVFGSELLRAYKVVGFPVNVAARLQSAGDPGSILCGFRTYALIKDRVSGKAREPLAVKGASRPVEAWEIAGIREDHPAGDRAG
jgi:PAS domain S-box-containing protein